MFVETFWVLTATCAAVSYVYRERSESPRKEGMYPQEESHTSLLPVTDALGSSSDALPADFVKFRNTYLAVYLCMMSMRPPLSSASAYTQCF